MTPCVGINILVCIAHFRMLWEHRGSNRRKMLQ